MKHYFIECLNFYKGFSYLPVPIVRGDVDVIVEDRNDVPLLLFKNNIYKLCFCARVAHEYIGHTSLFLSIPGIKMYKWFETQIYNIKNNLKNDNIKGLLDSIKIFGKTSTIDIINEETIKLLEAAAIGTEIRALGDGDHLLSWYDKYPDFNIFAECSKIAKKEYALWYMQSLKRVPSSIHAKAYLECIEYRLHYPKKYFSNNFMQALFDLVWPPSIALRSNYTYNIVFKRYYACKTRDGESHHETVDYFGISDFLYKIYRPRNVYSDLKGIGKVRAMELYKSIKRLERRYNLSTFMELRTMNGKFISQIPLIIETIKKKSFIYGSPLNRRVCKAIVGFYIDLKICSQLSRLLSNKKLKIICPFAKNTQSKKCEDCDGVLYPENTVAHCSFVKGWYNIHDLLVELDLDFKWLKYDIRAGGNGQFNITPSNDCN